MARREANFNTIIIAVTNLFVKLIKERGFVRRLSPLSGVDGGHLVPTPGAEYAPNHLC